MFWLVWFALFAGATTTASYVAVTKTSVGARLVAAFLRIGLKGLIEKDSSGDSLCKVVHRDGGEQFRQLGTGLPQASAKLVTDWCFSGVFYDIVAALI